MGVSCTRPPRSLAQHRPSLPSVFSCSPQMFILKHHACVICLPMFQCPLYYMYMLISILCAPCYMLCLLITLSVLPFR